MSETTYVAFHITSEGNSLFAPHYFIKASKAEAVGNVILRLHKMIGSLNPWEAKKLYMALVDPHLTHGCEVTIDTKHGQRLRAGLEDKQKSFIRRILSARARSMLALLSRKHRLSRSDIEG